MSPGSREAPRETLLLWGCNSRDVKRGEHRSESAVSPRETDCFRLDLTPLGDVSLIDESGVDHEVQLDIACTKSPNTLLLR